MTVKPVLHYPQQEEPLRVVSEPIAQEEILSADMRQLVQDMKETMRVENGIGLAAPQIGKHIRLIIVDTKKGPEAFFNPRIVERSDRLMNSEEGCLSVPGVYGVVTRHKQVTVHAENEDGRTVEIREKNLLSAVFQHEIDHLDGILFIDRAHTLEELTPEKEESII